MKINLVQIGNSKGIRIPKSLIDQYQLAGEIELIPSARGILIRASIKPRNTWEGLFKSSIIAGHEVENPEWKTLPNKFDKDEWSW